MSVQLLPTSWPAVTLFGIAAAVCSVAHVGILRSVLRAKRRGASEIAWAVLPAAALVVVLVMTWRTMHAGA